MASHPAPSSLPPPRHVLTSLINEIGNIPLLPARIASVPGARERAGAGAGAGAESATNALRQVPASHRYLIVTLHVLFPSLVLPALDLLDRGLVSRLVLDFGRDRDREQAGLDRDDASGNSDVKSSFYLVRSAQQAPRSRRHRSATGSSTAQHSANQATYMVRLDAWNCTCAAFAFAAFPPLPDEDGAGAGAGAGGGADAGDSMQVDDDAAASGALGFGGDRYGRGVDGGGNDVPEAGWSFGGISFDGMEGFAGDGGQDVPVCKHLLACLLAARWGPALGRYVVERKVQREEMAGIVAEI